MASRRMRVACSSSCLGVANGVGPGSVERVDLETCRALVGRNWHKMLSVFRELLSRCSGEAVILQLLKVPGCLSPCRPLLCCHLLRLPHASG